MKEYPITSVLWKDHIGAYGIPMMKDPQYEVDKLTLSIGFLYRETPEYLIIVSDVNPHGEIDECNYVIILKATIVATNQYGNIEMRKLRL